jgi:GNAT superfamily N-acetyltransferase
MKVNSLKLKKISQKDFLSAMKILDNELGKNRVRSSKFLEIKFKENPNYFIGIYLENELVGVVCGFPREDYLLMSEIAVDCRFQGRGFGKKLVKEFEKQVFKKYSKINVGALDEAIEFYKKLNYKPFLIVQFEKGVYDEKDFSDFEILAVHDYGVELKTDKCDLNELKKLRKIYQKANLQYIFSKRKNAFI